MELFFPGPTGRLQGLYEAPAEDASPRAAAVVCHPHPVYGGTLHNTVVFRMARALRAAGLAALRFNFRGVEQSGGQYDGHGAEQEDVAAALDWLAERHPGLELWAAGFSFGARSVCGLAPRDGRIARLVAVALPTRILECRGLESISQPALFLCGGQDEFGTLGDLLQLLPDPPAGFEFAEIPAADHMFRGCTPVLEERIRAYAQNAIKHAP